VAIVADLRSLARWPHFGQLYASRLLSQAGDGIFQVALASYVIFSPERQPSAAKVAAAFATLLLPYSVVGPFAGVLIDRWRRQRILVVGNLVRTGLVLLVAALVLGSVQGPLFFASALAVVSVNRFFLASLSAALPHVVPDRLLALGNSVSTTSGTLIAVVGGGVGYLVRVLLGSSDESAAVVVTTAAAMYAIAALVARRMDKDLLGPDPDLARPDTARELHHVLLGVIAGARHVRARPRAAQALLTITAHRFFYGISTVSILLLYRNYFHDSDNVTAGLSGLALVVFVSGAGFLVAAVATPAATRVWGERSWLVALFAMAGVVEIVFGIPYTQPLLLIAAFLLGVTAQGAKITVDTIVQQSVTDAFRGRVFSFYDILFNVSFVAACVFAALVLPESGKSYPGLAVVAVGYLLTAVGYGWRSRTVAQSRHQQSPVDAPVA
jgi:MFS family permease